MVFYFIHTFYVLIESKHIHTSIIIILIHFASKLMVLESKHVSYKYKIFLIHFASKVIVLESKHISYKYKINLIQLICRWYCVDESPF